MKGITNYIEGWQVQVADAGGRKKIKNYKIQITNKMGHELHELPRISEKKETSITTIATTKGSYGLHQDSFKLQNMTALIKSFCGGVQGGQFFQKAPSLAQEA